MGAGTLRQRSPQRFLLRLGLGRSLWRSLPRSFEKVHKNPDPYSAPYANINDQGKEDQFGHWHLSDIQIFWQHRGINNAGGKKEASHQWFRRHQLLFVQAIGQWQVVLSKSVISGESLDRDKLLGLYNLSNLSILDEESSDSGDESLGLYNLSDLDEDYNDVNDWGGH
jgi:hypothetical protein